MRCLLQLPQGLSANAIGYSDGRGNKPWGDASLQAPLEFWKAKDLWYPTWGNGTERALNIKSVKMWSEGACGSTPR